MPLFEYQCSDCNFRFEELVSSAESSAPACPKCGSKKTERQLSTFSASVKTTTGTCETGTCSSGSCSTGTCPFA